jgi:hypothetical protein
MTMRSANVHFPHVRAQAACQVRVGAVQPGPAQGTPGDLLPCRDEPLRGGLGPVGRDRVRGPVRPGISG